MSRIVKILLTLIVIVLVTTKGDAQNITLHGKLRDSITHFAVESGTITSSISKQQVKSDKDGKFTILLRPNDYLQVLAEGYRYDTLQFNYLFKDTITFELSPTGNLLPGVTVRSQYSKYQLDSINRRKTFEKNRGQVYKAIDTRRDEGFGLTINLDRYLKKKPRNQKADEQLFSTMEKTAYINYRFSPYVVEHYTNFKGEQLRDFMYRYSPTYAWLRQHPTNEDILYYINDKLKLYRESK